MLSRLFYWSFIGFIQESARTFSTKLEFTGCLLHHVWLFNYLSLRDGNETPSFASNKVNLRGKVSNDTYRFAQPFPRSRALE